MIVADPDAPRYLAACRITDVFISRRHPPGLSSFDTSLLYFIFSLYSLLWYIPFVEILLNIIVLFKLRYCTVVCFYHVS